MDYAQKYDIFFPFFIKVVVNRRFLSDNGYPFSLLSRALEYINTTEVLSGIAIQKDNPMILFLTDCLSHSDVRNTVYSSE